VGKSFWGSVTTGRLLECVTVISCELKFRTLLETVIHRYNEKIQGLFLVLVKFLRKRCHPQKSSILGKRLRVEPKQYILLFEAFEESFCESSEMGIQKRYRNWASYLFLVRRCNREGETNKYAGKERDAVV